MNYDKFISLVPKDTKDFVNILLPLVYYYNEQDKSLKTKNNYFSNYYKKMLCIFLIAYSKNSRYNSLLTKYGFSDKYFLLDSNAQDNISLDMAFPFIRDFLPNYDNNLMWYCNLTATDILLALMDKCRKEEILSKLTLQILPRANSFSEVIAELEKFNNQDKKNLKVKVEREIFADLKVGVVNYLETADEIFRLSKEKSSFSSADLASLSLLVSLFFYEDAPTKNNSFSEQQAIVNVLAKKNVTLERLKSKLKLSFTASDLKARKTNIFSVKEKYNRYIEAIKDKERKDIGVSDIFLKALDKNLSNSIAIDKLLVKLGVGVDSFSNLLEEVEKNYSEENKLIEEEKKEIFYMNLDNDTREFIEFSGRIYQIILERMKNHLINEKIVVNEDDADTLALYIASCYYGLEVDEFFREYGVTLEKVLKLLNLNISKKEIEAISLDKDILVDRFSRFLYEGVNSNNSKIRPEDIILNLCDKEFNKSTIMENIFESLNHQVNLDRNFTKQMHEAVKVKILKKENQLREKIFYDLNVEVINVLEKASSFYLILSDKRKDLEKQDKKALSLLASILYEDSFIRELFLKLGVSYEDVLLKMGIKTMTEKSSLEIIQKDFGDYIFGGYNKEKMRRSIDVYSILKNVFNTKLNNSVYYKMFLNDLNLSYEKVFSEYEVFSKEKEKSLQENKIKEYVNGFDTAVSNIIKQALFNYSKLENLVKKNNDIVQTEADLVYFSMILAILNQKCKEKEFFEKQEITLENVLNKLDISLNLRNYKYAEIDFFKFENIFKHYFPFERQDIELKNLVGELFDSDNEVLKRLVKLFKGKYEILENEIKSGISYEDSLTLADRIEMLNDSKVSCLTDDYSSILNFDNELVLHTKYINRELPKLVQSKVHETSIDTINEVLSKVYSKEEKKESKKSFLKMLFGIEADDKGNANVVFNPNAINELSEKIDDQIKILYNEFIEYEGMSNYIDAYRKKNNLIYEVVKKKVEEVKERLDKIDKNNEEIFGSYLKLNTLYNALIDKMNRLSTTSQIMKQNLVSINQNMIMHVLTINTLKMARDDLIPLVISQLAITKGQESEKEGIELSKNIFSLFQSLLSRNVEGVLDNAKDLRRTIIDPETMALIDKNINDYILQFELEKDMDSDNLIIQDLKKEDFNLNQEKKLVKKV